MEGAHAAADPLAEPRHNVDTAGCLVGRRRSPRLEFGGYVPENKL